MNYGTTFGLARHLVSALALLSSALIGISPAVAAPAGSAEAGAASEAPRPAALTRPDLVVTRLTGPHTVFAGATALYEAALWNEGAPARGTEASVQIFVGGNVELVEVVPLSDGFSCAANDAGIVCTGPLGGVDDAAQPRGAVFRVQVRGFGAGGAAVIAYANVDGRVEEMTMENNSKRLEVTVQ